MPYAIRQSDFAAPAVKCGIVTKEHAGEEIEQIEVTFSQVIPTHPTFPGCTFSMIASYRKGGAMELLGTREHILRANGQEVPAHVTQALQFADATLWCDLLEVTRPVVGKFLQDIEDGLYLLNRALKQANGKNPKRAVKLGSIERKFNPKEAS